MIPNRAPSTVWALRRDFLWWVRTQPGDMVQVYVDGQFVDIDRPTARLLAKRINQCLDSTVKR